MFIESENLDIASNILADIFNKSHAGRELGFIGVPQTSSDDLSFLIHGHRGQEIPGHNIEKLAGIFTESGFPVLRQDKPGYIPFPTYGPFLIISRNRLEPLYPKTVVELKMIRLQQLIECELELRRAFYARFPANSLS